MQKLKVLGKYSLVLVSIAALVIIVLSTLGKKVNNTFASIGNCLGDDGFVPCPPMSTSGAPIASSVQEQLAQIDQALSQSMQASIAYNAPTAMDLGDTVTIELLLNPAKSPVQLGEQVTEPGTPVTATIEITPRMKAELLTQDKDAFVIQPIHASAEQIISGTETTKWSWYATAKKDGTQNLTIVIYRLVKIDSQEYWREVETYKANINVKVTFVQRITSLDWKWILGILVTALLVPAFWRWYDQRRKKPEQVTTPKRRKNKAS
jgi:hypothetical protein